MPIDRAAIRARVRKMIQSDLMKGDVPGHDFHGNQWTGGEGSTTESYGPGHTFEGPKFARVNTRLYDHMTEFSKQTGGKYDPQIRGNAVWTGDHEDRVRGNILKNQNRYKEPEKLIELGRHLGIAHAAGHILTGQMSYKRALKEHNDLHEHERTGSRIGTKAEPGKVVHTSSYGQPYPAWIPHEHDSTDTTKHARADHHVDQERSPRGTFGGHRPTVQSDDANSFMGTPNPDSATDMESSYGYHGPSASPEEAVAEAILTEAGNDGVTGELQGDFESGQQGVPQPTLWGLLSLSNRRVVRPVDGEPNIFDDVTRYINTVSGQPDTVLIDPGVTPLEQR